MDGDFEGPVAHVQPTGRLGGNRTTGYNWETNASSAGADWHHFNDEWFCSGVFKYQDCDQPGATYRHFVEENQAAGIDSLVTIQMAGKIQMTSGNTILTPVLAAASSAR